MGKIWYISLHLLFYFIWYLTSSTTAEMGKSQLLWKLTSLEWVSAYISFTYFFFALLGSFKSSIVKPKLQVSLYLLTVSILATSLLVTLLTSYLKQEEYEEFVVDLKTIFLNAMLKGGLFVISLIELGNLKYFDPPSWTILIIFDVYLAGWYCFVQYMCKKATGSYSYQILNDMNTENLALVGTLATAFGLFVKYCIISVKPKRVLQNKVKKDQ
jgi:hypothetical protein